jgi:hypothetical protein
MTTTTPESTLNTIDARTCAIRAAEALAAAVTMAHDDRIVAPAGRATALCVAAAGWRDLGAAIASHPTMAAGDTGRAPV